ncbi:hypothetical protein ACIPWF_21850 [Paenarthrobacter sp. NPDC089989]|uniref:hypothetical protein n=1 Tax=unclassified Paenarthrobacter TaxID=2634190 RepID=UPI003802CBDD
MAPLSEIVTKTKQWTMWSGTKEDFLRLLKLVEDPFAAHLPDHVKAKTARHRQTIEWIGKREAEATKDKETLPEYAEKRLAALKTELEEAQRELEDAEAEASKAGLIRLALTSSNDERRQVTAGADDLSQYIDGRKIQGMEFSAPAAHMGRRSIDLRADKDGLNVYVSSNDSQWSLASFAELEAEVVRNVPRLRFVRSAGFLIPLYFLSFAVALTTGTQGYINQLSDVSKYSLLSFYGVVDAFATFGAVALTQRLIPAFEIVKAGKRSGLSAALGVIGSALAAVALGVLGNVVFQAMFG